MSVDSALNLSLPAAPLTDDPKLAGELQIIYNALQILQQALNDAGIPSGGSSPAPSVLGVANGGTGVATITGIVKGSGTAVFSGIQSNTAGHILKVTGANTYAFSAPGYGDVTGPAGATAGNVAVFNGATGKVIADGGTLGTAAFTSSAAYDPAGAAAAITPATLGLVIGTNVQAYDADLTTWAGITPGANVGTALAIAVGSAGAFITFNGALGTPSSGTVTNLTGTASININGTVGATTPTTGTFTRIKTASGNTGAIASATPTTIFSISTAGMYLVTTWITGADAVLYQASAVIRCTGDATRGSITATNGAATTLTLTAAGAVQVTQGSGGNQTMQWAYQLIGQ